MHLLDWKACLAEAEGEGGETPVSLTSTLGCSKEEKTPNIWGSCDLNLRFGRVGLLERQQPFRIGELADRKLRLRVDRDEALLRRGDVEDLLIDGVADH